MKRDTGSLLGENYRKIQPKLRMIANGDERVNALRSELCAALSVRDPGVAEGIALTRQVGAVPANVSQIREDLTPRTLERIPDSVLVNLFVYTADMAAGTDRLPGETARRGNLRTATVPLSQLEEMANRPEVNHIEIGQPLSAPTPEIAGGSVSEPCPDLRRIDLSQDHRDGEGVLIGIVDCGGFDFAHPDFLDQNGKTRWVRIWDQGGSVRPGPVPFGYGSEFTQQHLNAAMDGAAAAGLLPQELEPQSQMVEGSHGTHVASIAAGNRGICRKAMIAGVLIALTEADVDRRRSFYDSTRLAHAVEYLVSLANSLAVPLSINISLGTNGHAHDGSAAISRWIDSTLSVPGCSVCVSAGNAGQEAPEYEGDIGWTMGRIHTSGHIPARELVADIEWLVVGNGIADLSENELEVWYSPQDRFTVCVRPPGGEWTERIEPGQFIENRQLDDKSFLSIYNELYQPANGCNCISVYLSPLLRTPNPVGVKAGRWTVRLTGQDVRVGGYHGWIERDDPRPIGRLGDSQEAWLFPSFFSQQSNVDDHSVDSLSCGHRVVSVANLDEASERISRSSSQGPTRDGRFKPDIAAPGTRIVAAKGFAGPDDLWVEMSGTSMASPYVAGVIGLMFAMQPKLTAAQIVGIIHRTGQPLPGADYGWSNAAGFGRIAPPECIKEAKQANWREDHTDGTDDLPG